MIALAGCADAADKPAAPTPTETATATPEGVTLQEARVDPAGERIIGVIATDREAAVGLTARGVVIGAMWVTHAGIVSETVPVGARWRVVMPVGGVDSRGGIMKGDNE